MSWQPDEDRDWEKEFEEDWEDEDFDVPSDQFPQYSDVDEKYQY